MAVSRFLYPRIIIISRGDPQTGVGFQPSYSADIRDDEVIIAAGIPASIQALTQGSNNTTGLPTDGTMSLWHVFIPLASLAKGSVNENDIVTDDEQARYQVLQPYWDSLGYRLGVRSLSV